MRVRSRELVAVAAALSSLFTLVSPAHGSALVTRAAAISVHPHSGPPGTGVVVEGSGFVLTCPRDHLSTVFLTFVDSGGVATDWGHIVVCGTGSFSLHRTIPSSARTGVGQVTAEEFSCFGGSCTDMGVGASGRFTVTSLHHAVVKA